MNRWKLAGEAATPKGRRLTKGKPPDFVQSIQSVHSKSVRPLRGHSKLLVRLGEVQGIKDQGFLLCMKRMRSLLGCYVDSAGVVTAETQLTNTLPDQQAVRASSTQNDGSA